MLCVLLCSLWSALRKETGNKWKIVEKYLMEVLRLTVKHLKFVEELMVLDCKLFAME